MIAFVKKDNLISSIYMRHQKTNKRCHATCKKYTRFTRIKCCQFFLNNPFTRMMVRQIVENIGYACPEICSPEELLGKSIVVVTNLEPRKMRGLESEGMLLAASTGQDDQRQVVVLTTDKPVPPGSEVS